MSRAFDATGMVIHDAHVGVCHAISREVHCIVFIVMQGQIHSMAIIEEVVRDRAIETLGDSYE